MKMKKQSQFRRPAFGFSAAALLCLTVHSAMAATTWDATADFSVSTNPNGAWSYQWLTGLAPGQYGNMANSSANWFGTGLAAWGSGAPGSVPVVMKNNSASTFAGWAPGVLGMHPDNGGVHAVVTWTVPVSGAYSFVSSFTWVGGAGQGDGVIPSVSKNVFGAFQSFGSQHIGNTSSYGNTWSWNDTLNLNAGDTISWAINPNAGGNGADSTVLSAVITAVPEPSTSALVAGALVCGSVLRRNRRQRASL